MTDEGGKFNTALLDYVQRGSVELMQSLLRNDNPDLIDQEGKTLLHYAAESNNTSMTQHFINNNYDVNILDKRGNSPLMLAVAKDSFDTTKLLVEAGANIYNIYINDEIDAPETPPSKLVIDLRNPALNKTYELVESILKRLQKDYYNDEKKLLEYLRDFGCSLVQIVSLKNANMTRLMLENGYSVDERDLITKETALHKAVKLGYFDNVKVLLEFGASVDALDGDKYPPLYYLCDGFVYWRFFSGFRKEKEDRVEILKILIEHGALSSQAPNDPMTPVQFIFEYGELQELTALMQYDVDFNSYASLQSLLDNQNDFALEVLRGRNVNVNAVRDGFSLLSIAIDSGSWRKVQFLLEHGADPNVVNVNSGETPLINAFNSVEPGNLLAIVRSLLQYGADAQYAYTEEQLTVFDLWEEDEKVLELIIAHLALIESCGVTISDLIRGKIDSRDSCKLHFQVCKNNIGEMKETTVNGSVTLYKLLTKSHTVITRYARDPEFTAKFEDAMKVKWYLDPHFLIPLHKRVGEAIREAKLKEEALIVLKKIFPRRFRNCHGIFDVILDCLTWDDLKNVCKVYDLQESEPFNLNTVFV